MGHEEFICRLVSCALFLSGGAGFPGFFGRGVVERLTQQHRSAVIPPRSADSDMSWVQF